MTLTGIRAACDLLGVRPAKGLGQNFLHDDQLRRWIVQQLGPDDGTPVLEIGPGLGALTDYLVDRSGGLTVIEKDGRLARWIRERFAEQPIVVHEQDATDFDTRQLFPGGPVDIVANLPYSVTSPVLFRFTSTQCPARQVVVMVQKELAERLSASPSTSEYGRLTLVLGRSWKVEFLRNVPPEVFWPRPGVDSAIVRLTRREPGEVEPCDPQSFNRLVKRGFSQRRKQLHKMLKDEITDWPAICAELDVPVTVRAEALDLHQWVRLTRILTGPQGDSRYDVGSEIFDVVNENDEKIGKNTRSSVHVNNLRHRAVHLFIFNRHGELVLQKRSHLKDKHPGVWDSSAAGHLDADETYDAAAARELVEEIGVDVPLKFHSKLPAMEQTGWEFVQTYTATHEGPFRVAPEEIDCVEFFPLDLVRRWIAARPQDFAPGFLACFEAVCPES